MRTSTQKGGTFFIGGLRLGGYQRGEGSCWPSQHSRGFWGEEPPAGGDEALTPARSGAWAAAFLPSFVTPGPVSNPYKICHPFLGAGPHTCLLMHKQQPPKPLCPRVLFFLDVLLPCTTKEGE